MSLENIPHVTFLRECVVLFRSEEIKGSETDNVRANIAFVMRKLKVSYCATRTAPSFRVLVKEGGGALQNIRLSVH